MKGRKTIHLFQTDFDDQKLVMQKREIFPAYWAEREYFQHKPGRKAMCDLPNAPAPGPAKIRFVFPTRSIHKKSKFSF